jgi:hypothetical protein
MLPPPPPGSEEQIIPYLQYNPFGIREDGPLPIVPVQCDGRRVSNLETRPSARGLSREESAGVCGSA